MLVQLADQLLALRSGAMTLADFATATSSDAMAAALTKAVLPGRMVSPGQPTWHLAINMCTLPLPSLAHPAPQKAHHCPVHRLSMLAVKALQGMCMHREMRGCRLKQCLVSTAALAKLFLQEAELGAVPGRHERCSSPGIGCPTGKQWGRRVVQAGCHSDGHYHSLRSGGELEHSCSMPWLLLAHHGNFLAHSLHWLAGCVAGNPVTE